MCEASHLLSLSSSSQHSSTAGEDAHDCRQETADDGYTERNHDVIDATKHTQLDVGFILLQPPEHRGAVGTTFLNALDRRRSFGLTYLDQKDHCRTFMRPFNTLLSEVEEESDRMSEAVGDSAGNESGSEVVAPEGCGLLHRRLPPLKPPPCVAEHKDQLSTIKDKELDAGGIGDSGLSLPLSTYSLNLPLWSSDSLIFELSSTLDQESAISLLTVVNEESHGTEESDGIKLSPNDERDRNAGKLSESVNFVQDPLPAIPIIHRSCKRGISWWVPLNFTSDDHGNDAEVSSRDDTDKLSLLTANTCFLGEEIFTDTSSATDSPRTEITACQKCTDLLPDSNQSTAQRSSEEQQALGTIRRSKTTDPGFKDMKNIDSLSVSGRKDTRSRKANATPFTDAPSRSLYPDMGTNVSICHVETRQTNDSDESPTRNTRTRVQKRFDEEELRFPEITIPKRNTHKPKSQNKKTSRSLSSLQQMQDKNTCHSVYQRTTKDGKGKDRLNSWREMQTRKRSSRKNENKKHNRSKRRHHSWSSMDHLCFGSSSEERSKVEKKASKTTKTSDTVFADGKSKKDGHDYPRLERSNSSSSVSSMFSINGAKCMDKVVNSGGIQELIGSGNDMQLQEISFHYVPSHAASQPVNRKRLITAAEQGDSAIGKSPSSLRIHLKAPVEMSDLLKKVPSGSYVTIESPGAYVQEREITVGMVLVDTLRCEGRKEQNTSSAQEITNVEAPQTYHEKLEDTPVENSKNLSTSAPAGDCGSHECVPGSEQKSVVDNDNAWTNKMETSRATENNTGISAIESHSPCRKRCCNADCWICQLSTLKVIQYTQGLDDSIDLPTSKNSERAVEDTPSAVKPASNEHETATVANVSSIVVQRFSSVVCRTQGIVGFSASNERVPLPEPGPVGDVPQEENCRVGVALPTSQNDITKSKDTSSAEPKVYRTTMEIQLYSDGTVLGGNSNSSSSGVERMTDSTETSKEVLSEGQKVAVHGANSNSSEEANNFVQLLTANNENKAADAAEASTEIIDIYRKINRRPKRKNTLTEEGIPETPTPDVISSYNSCAMESDVSLIPDEDEAVPQSSNTQSFPSGREILTSQNQGVKCTGICEEDGRNSICYRDHKSAFGRFKLEYDILSKVMLFATLRQLGIASASGASAAIAQPSSGNETCGSNEPDHIGVAVKPSLGVEVVSGASKVQDSQLRETNTKSTWTESEDINTTTGEQSAPQQALPVIPAAESQRKTEDIEEVQQSVPDEDDDGIADTNGSDTQLLATTSKAENKSSRLCTSGSVMLCTMNDKLPNIVEENASNDTEAESVVDSQETRDLEGFDFSTSSVSSSATRPKNKNVSCKTSSTVSSVKGPKLCSVEVRDKFIRPRREPKENHSPRTEPQNTHRPGSEPQKSYRPVGVPQQNRRPKKRPSRDRILSPREVYERRKMYAQNLALRRAQRGNVQGGSEYGETNTNFDENQSVSDGKSVSGSTAGKTATGKKARVMREMSENFKAGKDASPCSACSTKNYSMFSGGKERVVNGTTSFRVDIDLPAARERSMKKGVTGQWRGDFVKELHGASASAARFYTNSEDLGGTPGANHTPPAVAANDANELQGRGLKSNAVNDATDRTSMSRRQSKKSLRRKTSPDGATELSSIEVIDKPSLCETWLMQHYSDSSNHGSVCDSTSIDTAVETVILKKCETKLLVAGNPPFDSEGSGTTNDTVVCPKKEATGGAEGEIPTLPKPRASLPSQKRKFSKKSKGELKPPSGDSGVLMIPYGVEAIPLLTYTSQNTQVADSPPSRTDVGGKRKKEKPLHDQSDGSRATDISHPSSVPGKKSVATSPILLRRNNVTLQDSHQISLTVERFSFCSTGVNTSLSVTHLSSRSMGVQCPSSTVSKCPSATTDLVQSIMVSEVKRDSQVSAASGIHASLTEVATKLESQQLVQKSVATQWLRQASVPNLAMKSPGKKTGKQTIRGSSNKSQGGTSKPTLWQYDLGLNEVQMEAVRALHRRRMFRAFSTNSLALGTNQLSAKRILRRLFRKKRKKVKPDGTEGKSKSPVKKKKEEGQPAAKAKAKVSATASANSSRVDSPASNITDRSARSSATPSDLLLDAAGRLRKNGQQKLKEGDEKATSPRMLLVRGAETPQRPALFEDLEGASPAGSTRSNWCSVHSRPVEDAAPAQAATDADSDEVSAAVAQVNSGARVLRVSLADDESSGCADLGSVEFVMRGSELTRQPPKVPSVLERLRRMLTWRT